MSLLEDRLMTLWVYNQFSAVWILDMLVTLWCWGCGIEVARGYVNQAKWLVEHGADYRIKPGKGMPRELKGLAKRSRSKKMEEYINSLFK